MRLGRGRAETWVAVDADGRTVRAVAAERRGRSWTLTGWVEVPLEPEMAPAEAVPQLLDRLPGGSPARGGRLVLVLPRGMFLERLLTLPPLAPRLLPALVREELDAALPWTAEERLEGFTVLGRSRRALAVAGQRSALAPWLAAGEAAGLRPGGVVPAGVALLNAFSSGTGLPERGFLAGGRDEVDLVSLNGGEWAFWRSFLREEAEEEVRRSRAFAAAGGEETGELFIPEGAGWAPADGSYQTWQPAGVEGLPPAFWAAWGALLTAGGGAALPLLLDGQNVPDPRRRRRWLAVAAGAALVGLLAAGTVWFRDARQREASRQAAAAATAQESEVAAWRRVRFPLADRLTQLNTLAARLPAGTHPVALRLEEDRLVELRAVAPRASGVLSALNGAPGLSGVSLSGPVTRNSEGTGEAFTLSGRLQQPASPGPRSSDVSRVVAALKALSLAGYPPDQALTRLLVAVERAAGEAGVRLETKSAQLLTGPSGRQRLGIDVSFTAGDPGLAAFLTVLGQQAPLLSLDVLTARRSEEAGSATLFRLQLVLDRPAGAASGAPSGQGGAQSSALEPAALAKEAGLAQPRVGAYPDLQAGHLFGLVVAPAPAAAPRPSVSPAARPTAPPPPPPRSSLTLLGVVYDPASPRALLRPAGGGSTAVVKPGDVLNGEKILEVRRDGIIVEVEGHRVQLPLPR